MTDTNSTQARALDSEHIATFAGSLRGRVVRPEDAGFPEACTLWNGMVTRRPRLVVRPTGAAHLESHGMLTTT